MNKTQIKKIYDQFKAFQSELDKGIPFKIKIGNKNLEVLITNLFIYIDYDELYIDSEDYKVNPMCDLSKWLHKHFDIDLGNYVSHSEISTLTDTKKFKARLNKLQKEFENTSIDIIIFNYAFCPYNNSKNFNNFYTEYLNRIKFEERKESETVTVKGVEFTKEELINIVKRFDK